MKMIASLLLKVLVKQFYIINAGFFLFLFFFFFGIINGGQLISYHQSLILGIISSPVFMGLVWLAWMLYNIKCIVFCNSIIKAEDSSYIFVLKALPAAKQFVLYSIVAALQYLPVLVYSFFVITMAFNRSMLLTGALVAIYQLLMIGLAAGILFITINKNMPSVWIAKAFTSLTVRKRINVGYYGFLPAYILYEKKFAFTVIKIFSLLLLSVSFVRNGDQFDEDLFSIFFQLIFAAHAVAVFYCVDFNESQMQFGRNLPLNLLKIAGMYLFTFCMLMLPELIFMLVNNHSNLPVINILLLYLTAVSTLFLYTAILYGCGLNMESYMLLVFIVFIMIFFLQKAGFQSLTLLGILVTAGVVFKTNYYSFERE
ncbi:MAG: hypothetical protein JWP81_797 [Ferruginibacter sp.]|nr:hypothetical protein [Ferruginibacter sp.]